MPIEQSPMVEHVTAIGYAKAPLVTPVQPERKNSKEKQIKNEPLINDHRKYFLYKARGRRQRSRNSTRMCSFLRIIACVPKNRSTRPKQIFSSCIVEALKDIPDAATPSLCPENYNLKEVW
jgi:hypothetical protein